MASVALAKLEQFTLKDIEGLDKRREKGRGCYGAVYEVELNGVPCIAKRLHDILVDRGQEEPVSAADRRAAIRRFREECVLLSGLRHPNIVQMLGVHYGGSDEADISLIMEYMHMDLQHCMKTYPDIPLPYKTSILRDVAYGLAYLHSLNIIHRDINAGNVLLTESLKAKIADLGVAKLLDRETAMIRTRTVCPGAQDFMPPECLDESPKYETPLDIFSFGHLIIYLSNQKPPVVTDRTVTATDFRKNSMQVGKRRQALDQMGGPHHPLYSTVVQCLSDTPDQRPTSRDLVRRMEEICKQHPIPHENTLHMLAKLSKENNVTELRACLAKLAQYKIKQLAMQATIDELTLGIEEKDDVLRQMREDAEKLQCEIAVIQAQATTYREDFLQERKDREAYHDQLHNSREKSTISISSPQLKLDETKKLVATGSNKKIEQLQEENQLSQSQIIAYKKQLDACKKELEEERVRGQIMQDRIDALNALQEQTTKPIAEVLRETTAYYQMEQTRLELEMEQLRGQCRELERRNAQLKSSNQILSTRLRDALKKEPYSPTPVPSLPVQPHQPQQQYHDATPDSRRRDDAVRLDQPTSYDQPSEIPFDPSLVCPKCGRQFLRGEIQKAREHHEWCSGLVDEMLTL